MIKTRPKVIRPEPSSGLLARHSESEFESQDASGKLSDPEMQTRYTDKLAKETSRSLCQTYILLNLRSWGRADQEAAAGIIVVSTD